MGFWAARLQGRPLPTLPTMSFTAGFRNVSVGATLAARYFPAEVLFPLAFAPIFQQLITALAAKAILAAKPGREWRERAAGPSERHQ